MIGFEEVFDVNGSSTFAPEWLSDGKDPWSFYSAAFDATADESRVSKHGCYVKDGGKTPAREHFLEFGSNLLGRESFRVEQTGSKDMYMVVPEAGGYHHPFAVNNGRMARDFDCGGGTNGNDAALVHKNCAVFDWRFSRRGIDLGVN